MIQQSDHVVRHDPAEPRRVGKLGALAEPSLIRHDHPEIVSQRVGQAAHGLQTPQVAVEQHDRLAAADDVVAQPDVVQGNELIGGNGEARRRFGGRRRRGRARNARAEIVGVFMGHLFLL